MGIFRLKINVWTLQNYKHALRRVHQWYLHTVPLVWWPAVGLVWFCLNLTACSAHSDQQRAQESCTRAVWCTCCLLSRLIWWSAEEYFSAEPHCVFRGADGEADGTRVLEDLVVVSSLIRKQILKINESSTDTQSFTYMQYSPFFFLKQNLAYIPMRFHCQKSRWRPILLAPGRPDRGVCPSPPGTRQNWSNPLKADRESPKTPEIIHMITYSWLRSHNQGEIQNNLTRM